MNNNDKYTKWVACWGNATSITDRKECTYSRDLTLRYPVSMPFAGKSLRLHLSNLTGTEPVTISEAFIALQGDNYMPLPLSLHGDRQIVIPPGEEVVTDALDIDIHADDTIDVSLYMHDFTQMNSGTLITGPLSKGYFAYGNHAASEHLPIDLSRTTGWFYFLNTIDILTEEENHALVCFGDSITAQSWPDYLSLRARREGYRHVAVIRRAVSGTRILRQYDCIRYQAYGLKGATRFPIEMNVAGASAVIIQHGINDIIHPVGTEVNIFRPMSDLPSASDMAEGVEHIYVDYARRKGLKVWSGTLLPIWGWRTYEEWRNDIREEFNGWLRTSPVFDGCIDFDKAVRDPDQPKAFRQGFDSGDHLHPSEEAYKAMAEAVDACLF